MNLDHHEEYFRKRLQQHQVPVNTSKLWNEIHPFLDENKKKKRPLIFWWIFGNGLIIAAITIFLANHFSNHNHHTIPNSIKERTPLEEIQPSPTENLINPTNTVSNQLQKPVAYHRPIKNKDESPHFSNNPVVPQQIGTYISSDERVKELEQSISSKGSKNMNINSGNGQSVQSEAKRQTPPLPDMKYMISNQVSPLSHLSLSDLDFYGGDLETPILKQRIPLKNKMIFAIEAGAQTYAKNTQAGYEFSDLDASGFLSSNKINNQNSLCHTQFIGLGLQYNLSKSIYLKTMVAYNRSTSFQQLNNVAVATIDNQQSEIIVRGDSSTSMADMELVDVELKAIRHSLDYSISTGYEMVFRKFTINAQIGLHANYEISRNGKYVNESGRFDSLNARASSENNQNSSIPYSFRTALTIGYDLVPGLNLFIGPSAQFYPKGQFDLATRNNANTYALMLGAKYRL